MFSLRYKKTIGQKLTGIFSNPIAYEVRVPDGNWTPYFGKYQNQRWGDWDSNSCWKLSQVNCLEDQMEWLWKNDMFSPEAKTFFTSNGYIDSDGDFSISEMFGEILGKKGIGGGNAELAWGLDQQYGCIPRSMLNYSLERAQKCTTQAAFVADYFNKDQITPSMYALGEKFLTYVSIAYQTIGSNWTTPTPDVLRAALKQAPVQIGIPIPYQNGVCLWNTSVVTYHGEKAPQHEIELYFMNPDDSYAIFDQYIPNLKKLSADYYIPLATQGIVSAIVPASENPVKQDSSWNAFWSGIFHWYNGIFDSTVPIGEV